MNLTLPYGSNTLTAELRGGRTLGTLDVADVPGIGDVAGAVREALENPIGLERSIFRTVRPGETVALVVSDQFRQTRADLFLPPLVDGLNEAGIRDEDILVCFATGTHRGPRPDEQAQILGAEIYRRLGARAIVHDPHDPDNLAFVGTTSRGTRVLINKRVHACDRIISTGAVVMHYFGGFGGGRKSILPGIAGVETISRNHSMNLDPHSDRLNPDVRIGALDGNPVAEDMMEGARFVKVDCILNTVLNRRAEVAGVFAGELEQAHRAAADFAYRMFAVFIEERADLVVASSGGTKNFVQSHKALFNAYQAMKPGGRIVFLVQSPEGLGGEQFVKWLRLGDRAKIIAGLRERSEINGQTALSSIEKSPSALFVTDMSAEDVAVLKGRKAADFQDALDRALDELRAGGVTEPTYYVMPSAAYTVPFHRVPAAV
jgi:nickel-dependent lactate racemase